MYQSRTTKNILFVIITFFFSPNLYAVEFLALNADDNEIYLIDSETPNSPTLVGTIPTTGDLYGIVVADTENAYTFDRDANTVITFSQGSASVLREVALDVDLFVSSRGFDVSPDGELYGVLPGLQLRTVDPVTGFTTFIATITGASRIESIAFSPNGTLYAVGSFANNTTSETLFKLNPDSGILTEIGFMNVTDIDSLTMGLDGFLYGTNSLAGFNAPLLKIDPVTGTTIESGLTGIVGANGLGAVPEPASVLVIVFGGLALTRRRF